MVCPVNRMAREAVESMTYNCQVNVWNIHNGCFIYQRLSLFRLRSIFVVVAKNVLRQIPYPKTNVHCLIFHGALPLFLLYQVNVYSMRFKRKPAKHFCLLSFFKYLIRIVFATTYIIYVKRFSSSFVFD